MKILFISKTNFEYNRVKILLDGLKKLKEVEVELYKLNKKEFDKKEFLEQTKTIDFIYIPPFRHTDAIFMKKRTKIPIIFDPLISTYLTKVIDYKHYWKAPLKILFDRISFNSCDILLSDTEQHRKYFSDKININKSKIFVLPIGANTTDFNPQTIDNKKSDFTVGFYGSFIPLQGIDKIIKTARILKNESIIFDIIGGGYNFKTMQNLAEKYKLDNINFLGYVPYNVLPNLINSFDISLGVFGDSLKADSVIPNKIYHYSSMKKCTITKNTVGIKEIFTDNENIILTTTNPEDIASKIMFCKKNHKRQTEIADKAYNLIVNNYNETKIAQQFIEICEKFISQNPK